MVDNSGNQNQFRFLTAAVLSMVVLFGWSYFFAPTPPAGNSNTAANSNKPVGAEATPAPAVAPQATPNIVAAAPDTTPNRQITIKSPLYEVTLDSRGALATSWLLLKRPSRLLMMRCTKTPK